MDNRTLLRVGRYAGVLLALFSFLYMYRIGKDAVLQRPSVNAWTLATTLLLCCAHAVFPFVSAYTWKLTVEVASKQQMSWRDAVRIYVKTNIAKYLPGNVMQYIGRNVVGARYGWTQAHLAFGSILEIIFVIFIPAGILLMFKISGLWSLPDSYSLGGISTIAAIALLSSVIAASLWIYVKDRSVAGRLSAAILKTTAVATGSMLLYTAFFYVIAGYFFGVHLRTTDFVNIACSLTVAGYASLLTPGLPGGIGVKESLSVVLVSAYGYDKATLVVVLLFARAFSVIGDVLAFVIVAKFVK
jgi:glycosyltransferase 2 family protein